MSYAGSSTKMQGMHRLTSVRYRSFGARCPWGGCLCGATSCMSGIAFVDSNILIYAHDLDAGVKRERAAAKLRELWDSGTGRLSIQVLQEFYVNATRKLATPIARSTAREIITAYGVWVHHATTVETVTRAIELSDLAQITFWDALIVASAEEVDAHELLSEDLNDGQAIVGIKVVNPLKAGHTSSEVHDGR
jgi:predicted nucleic acid-binding protein